VTDNAATLFNPNQQDIDVDGLGDVADPDIDGDEVSNASDNAALTVNPGQPDADGDLWGDVIDPDSNDFAIPGHAFVAELNGPYDYNPNVQSFVFLSAVGSETPLGLYFMELSLDLDNDGQYDDLTQLGPSSLIMSLNTSQLRNVGLDQPGQHTLGLRVSAFQGSATDLAVLNVVPALPGDYNQDGSVNAADYTVWRDNLGSTTALPNDDTTGVGPDDYIRWKTNFGQTAGAGSNTFGQAVAPEPATLVLLMLAAAGWCLRRGWAA
jgi:hypothetical protein